MLTRDGLWIAVADAAAFPLMSAMLLAFVNFGRLGVMKFLRSFKLGECLGIFALTGGRRGSSFARSVIDDVEREDANGSG